MENKTHYVSVTVIVKKENKYLICQRSENESAFPLKWCVPGGKVELSDLGEKNGTYWFNILEKIAKKEVLEETQISIKNINYVNSLGFTRANGHLTLIISLCADYESGDVLLQEDELIDYSWVSLDEAKKYDLLDSLYEQIQKVEQMKQK